MRDRRETSTELVKPASRLQRGGLPWDLRVVTLPAGAATSENGNRATENDMDCGPVGSYQVQERYRNPWALGWVGGPSLLIEPHITAHIERYWAAQIAGSVRVVNRLRVEPAELSPRLRVFLLGAGGRWGRRRFIGSRAVGFRAAIGPFKPQCRPCRTRLLSPRLLLRRWPADRW